MLTKVDDQVIDDADALAAAVQTKAPGDTITLHYLDSLGGARTDRIVLGTDQAQQP